MDRVYIYKNIHKSNQYIYIYSRLNVRGTVFIFCLQSTYKKRGSSNANQLFSIYSSNSKIIQYLKLILIYIRKKK